MYLLTPLTWVHTLQMDGILVISLCLIELLPTMTIGIEVATPRVEEHLTGPGSHITHVHTTGNTGIETTVGKGTAPVLMHVHCQEVLFATQFDEGLLLVGELHILAVVPSILVNRKRVHHLVIFICFIIPVIYLITCLLEHQHAIDIIFAGSIVVATCQIYITREELCGAEGTAEVNVGHDIKGGPTVRGTTIVVLIAAEWSGVNLPLDGLVGLVV